MKKTIRKWRLFIAGQFEKEEAWLGEMSQKGFHFVKKQGLGVYQFEQGDAKGYCYFIAYRGDFSQEEKSFIASYKKMGFELLAKQASYYYFRCEASQLSDVFKLERAQLITVRNRAVSKMLFIIGATGLPVCGSIHNGIINGSSNELVSSVFAGMILAFYLYIVVMAIRLRTTKVEIHTN